MAEIELRSGNRDKALATLHEGLEATKHHLQIVWHLANLYMDGRKLTEAQALIQELHAGKFSPVFLSYLDGRMEFCQGHWLTAKNALEKIRPALSDFPAQQKMADFCIGVCYGKMENYDQQLLAFRRAVAIDPNFVPAHAGIAEVLLAAGQTSGAIEEYWQVVKSDRASAESWTNLASMLVLKNSHMDPADRDWDEVESALDTAVKLQPNLAQVAILRAEVMIAKNHPDVAERLLEDLRDKNPDRPEFWTVLVSLAERRTEWDKAERLLNDADKKFGDNVALRLARAQYLVRRYGNDAAQRLRALAEKTDKFSKTDVIQLNRGLVIPSLQANDDAQARRLCEIVSKAEPDDVHNHFLRFELALRAQDSTNLEAILNDIEKNTGRNYMWSYGQAVRLSLEAKGHDEKSMKALAEAQKYLAQARETRPTWSRLPLLAAGIYDQQGKFDQALENYQQAIKWGERNPEAVRRAVQLLYMRGKFTEAQRMLRQLDERHMPLTQELQQMDIEVALRQEDYAHAKELALKSTVIDPKNWQQQLWLGQVLGILGRRAKAENRAAEAKTTLADAEKAFRRAIELKPDIPETWISLVQFLVGIDEADKAKAVVAQAGEKLPAKAAPAALAQCYEALRDIEHAQEKYQQALAGDPSDPEILRRVADFYLRTSRLLAAEPLLQKLVDGKDKYPIDHVVWARRQLALSVAARGGYQNLQAARKLIEANLALGDPSVQDLRARATFQAVDADPAQRRDAIHTMEYLISLEEMTSPEDRYTLAKLYLNQGEWPKARTILRSLAARGADPRHTATYIGALLQHNELSEAEAWLGGLEKMMPDQFVSVNFRADIAVRRGQPDEALDVMQKFAEKPGAPPAEHLERLRLAGGGLEQLAAHLGDTRQKATSVRFLQKAEMAYRNYAEQGAAQQMFLAGFLARHGKTQEALAIVSDRWADSNPAAIAQALSVIGSGKSSPSQIQQAEGIFKDALKKFDRATPLLLGIAVLCANSDRDDEAEIYYREVIAKDPNNAEALNNLAGLLSHQPNRLEEAMQLVNRAIDVAGPMSAILDTRAVIFLVGKKPDRAMPDITTALADNLTPIHLFHQAWAYYQLGRRGEATDILAQAEKAGLTASSLDSHERPIYSAMRDDLR
jgi:tetratricopeptide (TPR) repeat protein